MKNQTDFSSRIGVRAVVAGMMTSMTSMLLLMSLIAALGLWNFNLNEINNAGALFWSATSVAWIISMYLAGFVASVGARAQGNTEGALNAIAACSASYLMTGLFFLLFASNALDAVLSLGNPQFYLRIFLGETIAFAVGIYGGVVGAHYGQRSSDGYKAQRRAQNFST